MTWVSDQGQAAAILERSGFGDVVFRVAEDRHWVLRGAAPDPGANRAAERCRQH
jgi:hypothetical protein